MFISNSTKVAIVGRPNVGKSTLFNKLTRTRSAIVKDEPGVTRDIQVLPADWWGREFQVMDTGGLTEDKAGFSPLIREQVLNVLSEVDLLLVVVDGRVGLIPEDREVLKIVQQTQKPYLLIVNKIDRHQESDILTSEFYEITNQLIPAAFEHDYNIDKVVEWIISESVEATEPDEKRFRLAIVGKPNAGKSSLCNEILGQQRMIVSEIAGTTVDSIESKFNFNGQEYTIIDTAGLRRSSRRYDGVEILSTYKTRDSIFAADLVLLMVDGLIGPTSQDAHIVEQCLAAHRPVLLVINKIDATELSKDDFRQSIKDQIAKEFHFFPDILYTFISAKTGYGINQLFKQVERIRSKLNIHISTSKLNNFFVDVIKKAPSPVWGTTNVKFYYMTQTQQVPPSFLAFCNHPEGVTPAYRRFVARKIQEEWGLLGLPVRIFVLPKGGGKRSRHRDEDDDIIAQQALKNSIHDYDEMDMDQQYIADSDTDSDFDADSDSEGFEGYIEDQDGEEVYFKDGEIVDDGISFDLNR